MVKKLTKHGNSLALVIDRPILDLLKIDPETPLDVSTDGRQLIVAPAKPRRGGRSSMQPRNGRTSDMERRSGSWPSGPLARTSWNQYFRRSIKFWKSTSNKSDNTADRRASATPAG